MSDKIEKRRAFYAETIVDRQKAEEESNLAHEACIAAYREEIKARDAYLAELEKPLDEAIVAAGGTAIGGLR